MTKVRKTYSLDEKVVRRLEEAAEAAGLNISLTLARTEENIASASALYHAFGYLEMLVLVTVVFIFRSELIEYEMRLYLIARRFQIIVY